MSVLLPEKRGLITAEKEHKKNHTIKSRMEDAENNCASVLLKTDSHHYYNRQSAFLCQFFKQHGQLAFSETLNASGFVDTDFFHNGNSGDFADIG